MDDFYALREQQERVRQRGADLLRTATTARDRLRRKLAQQEKDYAATQDRDQLRICGDLITANLYRMERGQSRLETENFYDPEGGTSRHPPGPAADAPAERRQILQALHQGQDGGEVPDGADGHCPPGPGRIWRACWRSWTGRRRSRTSWTSGESCGTRASSAGQGKKEISRPGQAPGVPHHIRLPGAGGPEQPPERQADHQVRRSTGTSGFTPRRSTAPM